MKCKGRKLVMGLVMIMACYIIVGNHKVQGATRKERDISLVHVGETANGGKLTVCEKRNGDIRVRYSTKGEKEGFHTAFLFVEQYETLEDRDVLSYHISTEKKLQMNVNVMVKGKKKIVSIEDDTQIMMKQDKKKQYEISTTKFGTFEIPEGFTGTVYLPIRTEKELQATGFGLVTVLERNQEVAYSVNSVKLSNCFKMKRSLFQKQFQPSVDTSMEIPISGEYYYKQGVCLKTEPRKELDCLFSLEEEIEGIRLDEDGRLWVTDNASAHTFTIVAQISETLLYRYKVNVVESWLKSMEYDEVQNFLVQRPADVKPIPSILSIPYRPIQWGMVVLAAVFSIYYIWVIKGKG